MPSKNRQNHASDDLDHSDPKRRLRALLTLRESFEPRIGLQLASRVIHERHTLVWRAAVYSALPAWLPLLDGLLVDMHEWPWAGSPTLELFSSTHGHTIEAARCHIDRWVECQDWAFRFAAFKWLTSDDSQRAAGVAARMLAELSGSHGVPGHSRAEGTLVDGLDSLALRREELVTCILRNAPQGTYPRGDGAPPEPATPGEDLVHDLLCGATERQLRALGLLRHIRKQNVGEALVDALVCNPASEAWWLACMCVVPVWLPTLERRLAGLAVWPFNSSQTLRILQLARGRALHSGRRHAAGWLCHTDWRFRFAGFRCLAACGATTEEARRVARGLLANYGESPEWDEVSRQYTWMLGFDDYAEREAEIAAYLEAGWIWRDPEPPL